jgi:hypothetical protein
MQLRIERIQRRVERILPICGLAASLAASVSSMPTVAAEIFAVEAQADVAVFNGPVAAPMEQQFRAQFEPALKVELSFVNRVCKLSDDERRILIVKSNDWLDKFVADYAKQGNQPQMARGWFGGVQPAADPRESIRAGVAKLVKAELPKEQAEKYAEESKKRAEFHKQAFIEDLVTRIDNELMLTPEQCEKITRSLTEHWDKKWYPQFEMLVNGMQIWPAVPDQWIRPHLSREQQIAWGRLNKQNGNVFFGGFPVEGQVIDDIDLKEGQREVNEDQALEDVPAPAVLAAPIPISPN